MNSNDHTYEREDMAETISQLRTGNIISFSDDCGKWLACDAGSEEFVAQLWGGENAHILIDHPSRLTTYVNKVPDVAWDLMEMSEKPLIIYLSDIRNLSSVICGASTEAGFRMATDKFAIDLCGRFRKAILVCSLKEINHEVYHSKYISRLKAKLSKIRIDSHSRFTLIEK